MCLWRLLLPWASSDRSPCLPNARWAGVYHGSQESVNQNEGDRTGPQICAFPGSRGGWGRSREDFKRGDLLVLESRLAGDDSGYGSSPGEVSAGILGSSAGHSGSWVIRGIFGDWSSGTWLRTLARLLLTPRALGPLQEGKSSWLSFPGSGNYPVVNPAQFPGIPLANRHFNWRWKSRVGLFFGRKVNSSS
jgi:hypothetical protein